MINKKIVLAGATGLVGKTLCRKLINMGYEIVILARDIASAKKSVPHAYQIILLSDTASIEKSIDGAYGVINLAGAPIVGKRWTPEYKKILFDSRIETTKTIVTAIKNAKNKPTILINGSAIGFYGMVAATTPYNETSPAGKDFLAQLCMEWEKEATCAEQFGTRVVTIRTAIVLDKHEGALPQMLTPFSFFLGGPIGSGKQPFPWIHIIDEVGIICFALENKSVTGPINAVAPEQVTNIIASQTIGKILHKPSIFPVPPVVLSLMFGEAATVLTTGVYASSEKIIKQGYTFHFPTLTGALTNILK